MNTASMVWRANEDVVMVPADHMDIVGHYMRVPAAGDDGREWRAYDLLRSASAFSETTFAQVWDNLFAWALQPDEPRPTEVNRPASGLLSVLCGAS